MCFVCGLRAKVGFLTGRTEGKRIANLLEELHTHTLRHRHTEEVLGFVGCVKLRGCDALGCLRANVLSETTPSHPRLGVLGVPAWRKKGISWKKRKLCFTCLPFLCPCERHGRADRAVPSTWIGAPPPAGARTNVPHVTF